jgi:hypothetical protein
VLANNQVGANERKEVLTGGTMEGEMPIIDEQLILAEVGTGEMTGTETETEIITHEEIVQGNGAHILRETIVLLHYRMDT